MTTLHTNEFPMLNFNFEGLRRHSLLCLFVGDNSVSYKDINVRTWLLHNLVSSSRHYTQARKLVALQNSANKSKDGAAIFYILDFSEQIEDCITSCYRACLTLRSANNKNNTFNDFFSTYDVTIEKLKDIRNQYEHMHTQIVSGEIGSGPITISLSQSGKNIEFRKLKLEIILLHDLIRGLYFQIASLFPNFDADSKPELGGAPKLIDRSTTRVG